MYRSYKTGLLRMDLAGMASQSLKMNKINVRRCFIHKLYLCDLSLCTIVAEIVSALYNPLCLRVARDDNFTGLSGQKSTSGQILINFKLAIKMTYYSLKIFSYLEASSFVELTVINLLSINVVTKWFEDSSSKFE